MSTNIAEFYRDRCILITGATGFMGKVLVEKLLRSCPDIKTIYLLIRSKGGHDIRYRLEELLKSKLFDYLRSSRPECMLKLAPIQGDITLPGLGISQGDVNTLIANVSVVFHAAATVKFDEALKLSLQMNVLGTRRLVELCHKMDKLVALVHVSTAYCNCDRQEVKEEVYPPPMDPYKLLGLMDWMEDDVINHLTPKIIGTRPNTYTFTKALAEHVLIEEAGSLPVAIVRPSIVAAAWREPIPGWVDNLNGPTGLIVGTGKGMLRTLYCMGNLTADLIPVDVPINLMIATAWHTATHRPSNIEIYNCVSGSQQPVHWWEINHFGCLALQENAMCDAVWYPKLYFTRHKSVNVVASLFMQWIPAYLMDMAARLAGKRPIMVKIAQKLDRAAACLEYFTTHEWKFTCDNVQRLWGSLAPADQANFRFEISGLDWKKYMENYCLGAKRFVMKEELQTIPGAKKHMQKMWWIRQASHVVWFILGWRLLMMKSDSARQLWYALLRLMLRMISYLPGLGRL